MSQALKKTKVIQITHDLALGGLQRVIVNICKSINTAQFELSVLCLRDLGCYLPELEELGIPVTLIHQPRSGTDYLAFLKVADHLRKQKPDVVHTHNTQPFIDGTIAALLSGVKKLIHTDHARLYPDKWRYMFAEKIASKYAHTVVGVSDHTSECLIKYEHISPTKIKTIPNGIDPAGYDVPIDKTLNRRKLGLPPQGPILGVAVRLSEQKGVTYLLKAMPDIIKKFPKVSLIIAGDGPLKDALCHEAKLLGIEKNVFFLGLRLDMSEILKLFDLYVLPSIWEGLPMIVLEALAVGCPIISSDVGGIRTAVTNGFNGNLVPPKDPAALANAIVSLLGDPDVQTEYSRNCKDLFYNKFTSRCMTSRYEELYLQE